MAFVFPCSYPSQLGQRCCSSRQPECMWQLMCTHSQAHTSVPYSLNVLISAFASRNLLLFPLWETCLIMSMYKILLWILVKTPIFKLSHNSVKLILLYLCSIVTIILMYLSLLHMCLLKTVSNTFLMALNGIVCVELPLRLDCRLSIPVQQFQNGMLWI